MILRCPTCNGVLSKGASVNGKAQYFCIGINCSDRFKTISDPTPVPRKREIEIMEDSQVSKNTDREIWRKGGGDGDGMSHYEPSIHVTEDERIGINVGGNVFEKTIEEWHSLAVLDIKPNLGFATTFELINELHARADVAKTIGEEWPKYRTIDHH